MIAELRKFLPRPIDAGAIARSAATFSEDMIGLLVKLLDELEGLQTGPVYPKSMTTAQRRVFVPRGRAPALVFDTDLQALCLYVAGVWFSLDVTAAP